MDAERDTSAIIDGHAAASRRAAGKLFHHFGTGPQR
jgi:hypothetical protein